MPLLYLFLTNVLVLPAPGSRDRVLLRHLLSFQSAPPAIFPQDRHPCGHLVPSDRAGFHCRSFRKLSQPATQWSASTHFETHHDRWLRQRSGGAYLNSSVMRKSGRISELAYWGRRRSVLYCSVTLTTF